MRWLWLLVRSSTLVLLLSLSLASQGEGDPVPVPNSVHSDKLLALPDLNQLAEQQGYTDLRLRKKVHQWQALLQEVRTLDSAKALRRVNQFFNSIPYRSDRQLWRQLDYWATPLEVFSRNGGDCEDLAIAKYLTLRMAGFSASQLRLQGGEIRRNNRVEGHLVLTVRLNRNSEQLVLDNTTDQIRALSQRKDLRLLYGFNERSVWFGNRLQRQRVIPSESGDLISKWDRVWERYAGVVSVL